MSLRKGRKTIIVAAWIVLAVSGVAYAAFQASMTVNGSVRTTDLVLEPSAASAVASAGSCEVSSDANAHTFSVVWGNAIAGDSCTLTLTHATASGARAAVLEGFTMGPFVNGEIDGSLGDSCGVQVGPGADEVDIILVLTVTDEAAANEYYDLSDGKLTFVPAGTEDLGGCK